LGKLFQKGCPMKFCSKTFYNGLQKFNTNAKNAVFLLTATLIHRPLHLKLISSSLQEILFILKQWIHEYVVPFVTMNAEKRMGVLG
jgi:hypothetical protein